MSWESRHTCLSQLITLNRTPSTRTWGETQKWHSHSLRSCSQCSRPLICGRNRSPNKRLLEEFSKHVFECEYVHKTWWMGVYLSENMLKQHAGGVFISVKMWSNVQRGIYLIYNVIKRDGGEFIWVIICSNNMQERRLFWLKYDQTCRRGVYLRANINYYWRSRVQNEAQTDLA